MRPFTDNHFQFGLEPSWVTPAGRRLAGPAPRRELVSQAPLGHRGS